LTNVYEPFSHSELSWSGQQPRAYADHIWEGYITFSVPEGQVWCSRYGVDESIVKQYIPLFIAPFVEGKREWYQPWLEKLEQVSPMRWHVIVKSPYLD
jgi:hypothetical protein